MMPSPACKQKVFFTNEVSRLRARVCGRARSTARTKWDVFTALHLGEALLSGASALLLRCRTGFIQTEIPVCMCKSELSIFKQLLYAIPSRCG